MEYSNVESTARLKTLCDVISVKSTDYCSYYTKHPDTFLQRKECWTCKFSDFGIDTGSPSDIGICRHGKARNNTV